MAFVIPVAALYGIGAAAGALGLGGTSLGLMMAIKNRMKHTTDSVTRLMNLTEGDHISLKNRRDLPFCHAIVVETVRDPNNKIKVVYHSGSKTSARVKFLEVDLRNQANNGELLRHRYEALICYPAEAVVARAKSLCSQYNSAERLTIIRNYWLFFDDDEHFADWCQIGFRFRNSLKACMLANYTRTLVSHVTRLSEGDHVMTDGVSGIVVEVGETMAQLEIVRFPSDDQRGPGRVIVNDIARLYRLEYDVAVGEPRDIAKEAALREMREPTDPMPYNSADEFAVWCKTSLHPALHPEVDWKVAGALAGARMAGRVWSWVHAVDELRPGDHIALKFGRLYYYQHAIVSRVEGPHVSIIYLLGNIRDISRQVVMLNIVDVSNYVRAEQLCKYFYDVNEWHDPETVIARATGLIGSTADRLPFKNPEHFAMWCKTGTYQLHC